MNTNTKIIFICFILISSYLWADEDVFNHPLMPRTMTAFNTTCANLASKHIIKGNFSQEKHLNRIDRKLSSSGNFIIAIKYGMVWETLQPFPSTMILGKDFVIQSRPDGRKSVISAQGNETFTQMADVISFVFSGQSQGLLENFEVFFLGSVSNWTIGLIPRDSVFASFVTKITMSGDLAIRSIRLFEQNGDIITYTLSNLNFPTGLNSHEEAYFSNP